MNSRSLTFRKNGLKFVKSKKFIKKVNVNLILAKVVNSSFLEVPDKLIVFPDNKMKISFYRFLKVMKNSKKKGAGLGSLGWKFQTNGFYTSFIESEKKRKIRILKEKIKVAKNIEIVKSFFQKFSYIKCPLKKRKSLKKVAKGLKRFEDFYSDYSNTSNERRAFFKILKTRRFFPSIFFSRLFLFAAKGRKKYRSTFFYLFLRKRKIDSLFHLHTLSSLKFKDLRKQRKKLYKKVAWKIKKRKKWRRRVGVSFTLFRLRQKLSQVFYVPKHFEINYKTFATNYLGYTDSKTTNTKIAFWLNLRKLLTFVTK